MAMTKAGRARRLRTAEKRLAEAERLIEEAAGAIGQSFEESANTRALTVAADNVARARATCQSIAEHS